MHYSIGVDVESDFYLGNPSRSRRNSRQIELSQQFIIRRHFAFPLKHSDWHCRLIVSRSRKYLALFGWDCGIPALEMDFTSESFLSSLRLEFRFPKKEELRPTEASLLHPLSTLLLISLHLLPLLHQGLLICLVVFRKSFTLILTPLLYYNILLAFGLHHPLAILHLFCLLKFLNLLYNFRRA